MLFQEGRHGKRKKVKNTYIHVGRFHLDVSKLLVQETHGPVLTHSQVQLGRKVVMEFTRLHGA